MSTPDAALPDAVLTASEPVGPAQGPSDAAPAPSREAIGSFSLERAKSSLRRRREREGRGGAKMRFTEVTTVTGARRGAARGAWRAEMREKAFVEVEDGK